MFGARCAKCGIAFSENDLVMRARQLVYHDDLDQNMDKYDAQKDRVMRARQHVYHDDQKYLDQNLDQNDDQKDLVMRARRRIYHVECFQCSVCGRRLVPGDEFCERGGADDAALVCRCDDIFRR